MKKIFTFLALGTAMLSSNAQVVSNKFFDNWSLGVNAGVLTTTTHDPFERAAYTGGFELTKQITPVYAVGAEAMAGLKTTQGYTLVDNVNATLLNKVNFSNWILGYTGTPRAFELEGVVGIGFNHFFGSDGGYAVGNGNVLTSKLGLNFNFNLGKEKAWTVAVKPAIAYCLEGGRKLTNVQYNINNSMLELTAGVAYHFKTSNGKHHFVNAQLFDQSKIDALNATINGLRSDLKTKEEQLADKSREVRELQTALNDCRNRKPVVETVEVKRTSETLESVVTFRQGKTNVDASQLPNVERIATYMKNHPNSKVVIKGYASPEGSAEINERIARERAEAVKDLLVSKYHIKADRIHAEGQGIGDMFSEPDWNRVSICKLEESK